MSQEQPSIYQIALAGFAFTSVIMTISQLQFSNIAKEADLIRHSLDKREVFIKEELDRRTNERRLNDNAINERITRIDVQLLQRNEQFLMQNEFRQYGAGVKGQLDIIIKQLQVLEQTRPTTGELQALNRSVEERIHALEGIVDRLRTATQPAK